MGSKKKNECSSYEKLWVESNLIQTSYQNLLEQLNAGFKFPNKTKKWMRSLKAKIPILERRMLSIAKKNFEGKCFHYETSWIYCKKVTNHLGGTFITIDSGMSEPGKIIHIILEERPLAFIGACEHEVSFEKFNSEAVENLMKGLSILSQVPRRNALRNKAFKRK